MDDKALEWVMKTENLAIPDADMATCKRKFAILDRRLSAALQRIAHGELGRQITQAAEDALREGRAVRGRELLRLIIKYFQTNRTADAVYNLADLQRVHMKGYNLEAFQNIWNPPRYAQAARRRRVGAALF